MFATICLPRTENRTLTIISCQQRHHSWEANPDKLPKNGCRGPSVLQAGN